MAFNQFQYSNVHELNLDWLLQEIKNQSSFIRDFAKNNTIKVHNPPEWNITTQYPAHNIVIDGYIAYLAIDNVPAGVDITNHDYWLEIMDITAIVNGGIAGKYGRLRRKTGIENGQLSEQLYRHQNDHHLYQPERF